MFNLENLLGSVEGPSNAIRRNRPSIILGKKCTQCDDGEMIKTNDRLCKVCGEELVEIIETPSLDSTSLQRQNGNDPMNFFDLLGNQHVCVDV